MNPESAGAGASWSVPPRRASRPPTTRRQPHPARPSGRRPDRSRRVLMRRLGPSSPPGPTHVRRPHPAAHSASSRRPAPTAPRAGRRSGLLRDRPPSLPRRFALPDRRPPHRRRRQVRRHPPAPRSDPRPAPPRPPAGCHPRCPRRAPRHRPAARPWAVCARPARTRPTSTGPAGRRATPWTPRQDIDPPAPGRHLVRRHPPGPPPTHPGLPEGRQSHPDRGRNPAPPPPGEPPPVRPGRPVSPRGGPLRPGRWGLRLYRRRLQRSHPPRRHRASAPRAPRPAPRTARPAHRSPFEGRVPDVHRAAARRARPSGRRRHAPRVRPPGRLRTGLQLRPGRQRARRHPSVRTAAGRRSAPPQPRGRRRAEHPPVSQRPPRPVRGSPVVRHPRRPSRRRLACRPSLHRLPNPAGARGP